MLGRLAALALMVLLTIGSIGCSSVKAARDPKTLVVLEAGDGTTLNPLYSNNQFSFLYQNLIFDQLVGTGDDFADIPALATSWKGTPDGRHWDVELRRGVKWSDGAPFTSSDVVWTWKTELNPAAGFLYRGQYEYIKTIRADGPYRVHFDLANANALFVSQALGSWILPEHILGKVPPQQLSQTNFGEHPIGTGAYVLKEWRHDEQLAFERNPHWWGGAQTIGHLVFRVVLNDQARIEAMEEGSADVDDGMGPSSYAVLQEDRANLRLLHIPDLFCYFLYPNFRRPGLGDVQVRRAIMYGWDREGLVKGLSRGDAELATSIVPSGLRRWYEPNVRRYPYDPARARAILDAAGYHVGADGVRTRGSTRLSYTLTVPGNGGSFQDLEAEFQADMREIGIAINVSTIDFATYLEETQQGNYDLAFSGWGGVPDPDQESLLGSDQVPPNGNNIMYYKSARADHDVRLGLSTIDPRRRKAIYDDMQRLVADDVPVILFEYAYYRAALLPRVHFDFARALPGNYLFRDIAHWSLGS